MNLSPEFIYEVVLPHFLLSCLMHLCPFILSLFRNNLIHLFFPINVANMQPNYGVHPSAIWLLRCKIICNHVKQINYSLYACSKHNFLYFCHIQYQVSAIPSKIYLIQRWYLQLFFSQKLFFPFWNDIVLYWCILCLWLQRNYQPENGIYLLYLQNLLYINSSVLLAFPVLQGTEALCRFISVPSKERSNTLCFWCWQRQE